MACRRDFINELTAELRCGRKAWRAIRPHVTRFVLGNGSEFFDWHEIANFIGRHAQEGEPEGKAA